MIFVINLLFHWQKGTVIKKKIYFWQDSAMAHHKVNTPMGDDYISI